MNACDGCAVDRSVGDWRLDELILLAVAVVRASDATSPALALALARAPRTPRPRPAPARSAALSHRPVADCQGRGSLRLVAPGIQLVHELYKHHTSP